MLGFDLETTGVDPRKDVPVSYALISTRGDEFQELDNSLVNPGCAIPPEATSIHGITDQMVDNANPLVTAIPIVGNKLVAASAEGVPVVGMNLVFDLTIVDTQWRFLTGEGLVERGWKGPVIDVLLLDRALDKYRKGNRSLSSLCKTYAVEHGGAHDARHDVVASIQLAIILARRFQLGEIALDILTKRQAQWHRDWAINYSQWRVRQGKPPLGEEARDWPLMRRN